MASSVISVGTHLNVNQLGRSAQDTPREQPVAAMHGPTAQCDHSCALRQGAQAPFEVCLCFCLQTGKQ